MNKKIIKKSKPAKTKVAKKTTVKIAKKNTIKKVDKPAKKTNAKKTNAKKIVVTKKVADKKQLTPAKPPVPSVKPIAAIAATKEKNGKKIPVHKKQDSSAIDQDEENPDKENQIDSTQSFFYEPPKAFIKRPDLKEPKPFIGKDKRTRYSDKELSEFKGIILGKLEEAQRDYELLKSTLSHKDDHGTDDTSPTFKLLEDGSDVMSKEETAQLASRQEKYIQSLRNALIRIENKSYGICRITGRLIPKERLRSVPHATTSIEGKMQQYA
jgi:DnaK suppressor protein